jgi:hypothetical protein
MKNLKNNKIFWIYGLSALCYFIQGIESLPSLSLFAYFKDVLHYSPDKQMFIRSILHLAWFPKILWGFCIDNYFSRKIWITISIIIDIITVMVLGLWSLPLIFLITFMSLNAMDSAIRDVAVDGTMCIEGKKYRITGKIQSIQWIFVTIPAIISGLLGGYLADNFNYKIAFLCLIPFYLLMFIPVYFYREERVIRTKEKIIDTIKKYKIIFKNKGFLWACIFLFLYKFNPSFGTPLEYIQSNGFKWSYSFMGLLTTISSVISIIGALIYYKVSKKIEIIKWLKISVFLGAITSLSYLYYTPFTALLYLVLYSFIGMAVHLLMLDFLAQSTINGLEATTFALLCGISNLSTFWASEYTGSLLYPIIGLNWLIVVSSFTSFLCLFIVPKLIIKEKA